MNRSVAVDYNTLSKHHLGRIYEGLLEFKPRTDTSVRGITSGRMLAYKGQLKLRIESEEFKARCLFT